MDARNDKIFKVHLKEKLADQRKSFFATYPQIGL